MEERLVCSLARNMQSLIKGVLYVAMRGANCPGLAPVCVRLICNSLVRDRDYNCG
jgi:hypothetical protein